MPLNVHAISSEKYGILKIISSKYANKFTNFNSPSFCPHHSHEISIQTTYVTVLRAVCIIEMEKKFIVTNIQQFMLAHVLLWGRFVKRVTIKQHNQSFSAQKI